MQLDELSVDGQPVVAAGKGGLEVWRATGNPRPNQAIGNLPPEYSGQQVAIGGKVGLFGNVSVFDTPHNVVSYTEKFIEDQQAYSASQIVTNDPSVILNSSPFSYGETLNIRGLYLFGNDAAFDGLFGVVDTNRHPIYGIERIEVLKGSNALLNGITPTGSVAGYLNYVPKRAPELPLTSYTQSYISRGLFQEHLDIGRRYGDQKEFGVRFNGAFLNGQTPFDNNTKDLGAASLGLDYRSDSFRMTADLGYQNVLNRGEIPYYLVDTANVTRIPGAPRPGSNTSESWQRYKSDHIYGATRIEVDLGATTTATFAYGFSRNTSGAPTAAPTIADNFGLLRRDYTYDYRFREDTDTFEGGVRSTFVTGPVSHKASISATHTYADARYGEAQLTDTAPTNLYNPIYAPAPATLPITDYPNRHNEFTGVAIGDTMGFLDDRVLITLGGRLQRVASLNVDSNGYDETALTPSYAVVVKPLSNVSLYANYIEGLQQGPTAPIGTTNANTAFAPFVAKQQEAGIKIDWFGNFGTTFSAFEIAVPSAFTNSANTFVVDGLQVNRGLEFNVFGELTPGVRLIGGFTLLDARLTKTESGTYDGNKAPGTPSSRVTLNGEVDVPFVPGLTMIGRVIYTDKAFFDEANTLFIPAWTRFDTGLRYAFTAFDRPTIFRFNVENVANARYWESAQRGYLYQGAPRTFYASVQVKF